MSNLTDKQFTDHALAFDFDRISACSRCAHAFIKDELAYQRVYDMASGAAAVLLCEQCNCDMPARSESEWRYFEYVSGSWLQHAPAGGAELLGASDDPGLPRRCRVLRRRLVFAGLRDPSTYEPGHREPLIPPASPRS